jgi:hypothetical protein
MKIKLLILYFFLVMGLILLVSMNACTQTNSNRTNELKTDSINTVDTMRSRVNKICVDKSNGVQKLFNIGTNKSKWGTAELHNALLQLDKEYDTHFEEVKTYAQLLVALKSDVGKINDSIKAQAINEVVNEHLIINLKKIINDEINLIALKKEAKDTNISYGEYDTLTINIKELVERISKDKEFKENKDYNNTDKRIDRDQLSNYLLAYGTANYPNMEQEKIQLVINSVLEDQYSFLESNIELDKKEMKAFLSIFK